MKTDITELAQSLKAAAEKATPGPWERGDGRHGGELFVYCDDALGSAVCEATSTYNAIPKYQRIHNLDFIALANPVNVLALVEALENAQRRIAELEDAEEKICAANVTLDAREELAERQLAELDSRTVTVKMPKPHAHLIWIQAGHAPADYWDDVAVSHSEKDRCCDGSERYPVYARWEIEEMLTAAGIKVEAE
ncbi:TPA: ead/Ea22-like family protein [Raoultella planticola]